MNRKGDQTNRGRAGKHGLFVTLPRNVKIDKRTRFGRAVSQLRRALIDDLGGDLSTQKNLIVDRIVFKVLKLCSYESHIIDGNGGSNPSGEKYYLAFANSLRLDLQALGLEKKILDPVSLTDYLKQKEANLTPGEPGNS